MSSTYNPNGKIPSPVVAGQILSAILSSTNASPIQVTFSAPPGYNDQDTVEIQNHQTNTAANGIWVVTKITGSVYALNGSTGNGVGGNTGTAQDFSLLPTLTLPSDGDLSTAASVNTPLEGTANFAPYLYRLTGAFRLINVYTAKFGNNAAVVNPGFAATTTASTSYVNATGLTALLWPSGGPGAQASDVFQYTAYWQWESQASTQSSTTLGFQTNGGSYSQVSGAPSAFGQAVGGNSVAMIDGFFNPGFCNSWDFSVMIRNIPGTSDQFTFWGGATIRVNHYRPN